MNISPEIRQRIVNAAEALFEQSGRRQPPSVDAVRTLSQTSAGDTAAVLRDWLQRQIDSAAAISAAVPDRITQAAAAAVSALWSDARVAAESSFHAAQAVWEIERAEGAKLRAALSAALEAQGAELMATKIKLVEAEGTAAATLAKAQRERFEASAALQQHASESATLRLELAEVEAKAGAEFVRAENAIARAVAAQHERLEISTALETQSAAFDELQTTLQQVEAQGMRAAVEAQRAHADAAQRITALTEQSENAVTQAQEFARRATELRSALSASQRAAEVLSTELDTERSQHAAARRRIDTLSDEISTIKSRSSLQADAVSEQAEQLKRLAADLIQARRTAAAAQDEILRVRQQTEGVTTQHAELERFVARSKPAKDLK